MIPITYGITTTTIKAAHSSAQYASAPHSQSNKLETVTKYLGSYHVSNKVRHPIMANVERLKQVRMAIVNFEENFNYSNYFTDRETGEAKCQRFVPVSAPEVLNHNCGTCACVAGFAVALSTTSKPTRDCWDNAAEWLGLTWKESEWLFTPYTYDEDKYDLLKSTKEFEYDPDFPGYGCCTQEQGVVEALRRIDHLIEYYSSNANSN
jgi:hypothetical protein